MNKLFLAGACAGVALSVGTYASAAVQLLDFKPVPITTGVAEMSWNAGTGLVTQAGAQSTGLIAPGVYDGNQPLSSQVPGGLQVGTPIGIFGVQGSTNNAGGSTTFFDASMTTTGMLPVAAAVNVSGFDVQSLGGGTFVFKDTSGQTVLLQGTITSAGLSALDGTDAASALSGSITYTGGAIYNSLVAAGVTNFNGSFAIALSTFTPVTISGGNIAPFSANAEGHFDIPAIPEPATLGLAALAVPVLARRRRA
jgi:hypothetical protein